MNTIKSIFIVMVGSLALSSCGAMSGMMGSGPMAKEQISVNAHTDKVWGVIADYCAIEDWHPAVANCMNDGGGNTPGATRILTLGDGGQIVEPLSKYSASNKSYTYSIISSPLPVANYISTITVEKNGVNGSTVTWEGNFESANGSSDDEAKAVVSGIYTAGLKQIKQLSEK
ncbi:MAG: SRPBCC family protein [Candidatus Porifericomitaceae bacterium WSBS_2022_MAG_OTU9]